MHHYSAVSIAFLVLALAACGDTADTPADTSAPGDASSAGSSGDATTAGDGSPFVDAGPNDARPSDASDASDASGSGGVSLASCTALISDNMSHAPAAMSMPGYLVSAVDATFGTLVTRVTGDPGGTIPNVGGAAGAWRDPGGSSYAKYPAWSADGLYLAMEATSAPGWLLLDGSDYHVVAFHGQPAGLSSSATTARWAGKSGHQMVYVSDNGSTGYWDPIADTVTQKYTGTFSECALGGGYASEGDPSADGRYVVVNCGTGDANTFFFAVDLQTGTKYPTITASSLGLSALDWASISQGGGFVVASQNYLVNKAAPLSLGMSAASFTADLGVMGHYDLGLDTAGNEVAYCGEGFMIRLSNGARTDLTATHSSNYHTSTRNIAAPGWGYVSVESSGNPYWREIVAQELKAGGKIRRIVNSRSSNDYPGTYNYDHDVYGAPSPDGRRVFYRSDWGNAAGPVYGFVADTRNVCP